MLVEALLCMAMNVYHEARGESYEGMVAVAEVVQRRVDAKGWPGEHCAVVNQKWQFSWTMDKRFSEQHPNEFNQSAWARSLLAATEVYLNGYTVTKCADHYYAATGKNAIKAPYWVKSMQYEQTIGNHKFYCSR